MVYYSVKNDSQDSFSENVNRMTHSVKRLDTMFVWVPRLDFARYGSTLGETSSWRRRDNAPDSRPHVGKLQHTTEELLVSSVKCRFDSASSSSSRWVRMILWYSPLCRTHHSLGVLISRWFWVRNWYLRKRARNREHSPLNVGYSW